MGRWSYSNKTEADNLKKIEIWWLKKYGYLAGFKAGGIEWHHPYGGKSSIGLIVSTAFGDNFVNFKYTQTEQDGSKKDFDYKVRLETTPCNYGNQRYWFICPLVKDGQYCGRRVGVLYKGGDYFGCRHCYNLFYSSQNKNRHGKYYGLFYILDAGMKADKIREGMKRALYAGKPTKQFKKLIRINEKIRPYSALLDKE